MRQFDIWWAQLPRPAGRRPVLLLSRNSAYGYLNKLLVAEITTRVRHIPVEVPLGKSEGLPQSCVANFDHIRTIPRSALVERVGRLVPGRHVEVKIALGQALAWEELLTASY